MIPIALLVSACLFAFLLGLGLLAEELYREGGCLVALAFGGMLWFFIAAHQDWKPEGAMYLTVYTAQTQEGTFQFAIHPETGATINVSQLLGRHLTATQQLKITTYKDTYNGLCGWPMHVTYSAVYIDTKGALSEE